MNEPATRQRPSIDLDDFERRMRQSASSDHDDDPLAELARLVGEQSDPYEDVFAREAVAESAYRGPAFTAETPRPSLNFAAIEAGLRGGISPHFDQQTYPAQHEYASQHGEYAGYDQNGQDLHGQDPQAYDSNSYDPQAYAPAAKSRRPVYLMAATIVVGVLGVGAAFALKGHSTNPSDVKTIMADAGPTKIQPPADASSDQGAQDSAILGKGQPAPTKLLSNVEEPVDVSQAVTADPNAAPATDAASIPVPPSPGQADGTAVASADPTATSTPGGDAPDFAAGMPAPKKVKVISVRPDGTILSDDQAPAAVAPVPAAAPAPEDSAAPPASDTAPLTTASTPEASAPKSATRVIPKHVAAAAPADDAAGDDDAAPPKPVHKAKPKPKLQKMAMAEPTDQSPTDITPSAKPSGSFAVQLAAPGSEAEARSASSKLAKKFSSALEGRHLGFYKAQSNGKSVFRVRVSSLSKDEALSLCEKLKSDGGTCFVAKN